MTTSHAHRLSKCASYYNDNYQSLAEKQLDKAVALPCGCDDVKLSDLVNAFECANCNKVYWYSFCLDEVVEEGASWDCEICGSCD